MLSAGGCGLGNGWRAADGAAAEFARLLLPHRISCSPRLERLSVQQHKPALVVALGVAHAADHHVAVSQAVGGVQVGEASLLRQAQAGRFSVIVAEGWASSAPASKWQPAAQPTLISSGSTILAREGLRGSVATSKAAGRRE